MYIVQVKGNTLIHYKSLDIKCWQ